jgi:hypothetical protein
MVIIFVIIQLISKEKMVGFIVVFHLLSNFNVSILN